MNKLQQEMETEKNKLQKELDQMVSVTLILACVADETKPRYSPSAK